MCRHSSNSIKIARLTLCFKKVSEMLKIFSCVKYLKFSTMAKSSKISSKKTFEKVL